LNAAADSGLAFPWAVLMGAGFGLLRLSTHDFWAMTPREICAAFAEQPGHAAFSRPRFEQLMQAFPDAPALGEEQP